MKHFFSTTIFILVSLVVNGQSIDYNMKHGFVAEGHDVLAYFDGSPQNGNDEFQTSYDGVEFRFHNQDNLNRFLEDPTIYIPQYGGWCAYAMAVQNKRVSINPQTYEIRDGKLYLFYNGILGNSLDKWLSEGPEQLIRMADVNWDRMKHK